LPQQRSEEGDKASRDFFLEEKAIEFKKRWMNLFVNEKKSRVFVVNYFVKL
jgi:hypothetical protein